MVESHLKNKGAGGRLERSDNPDSSGVPGTGDREQGAPLVP